MKKVSRQETAESQGNNYVFMADYLLVPLSLQCKLLD